MLDFNSRATYLVAIADWKAMYADLSQRIRDTRRAFKLAQSTYSKGEPGSSWMEIERLRGTLANLRDEATSMIEDRHRSKVLAQEQYLASRDARAVAA